MTDCPPERVDARLAIPDLRARLMRALERHPLFGRHRSALRVDYVPNWGGFVNASFRIRADALDVRVKLAQDANVVEALRRWGRVARRLHERYSAPKMLGWIRVPRTGYQGAVFEWVRGSPPKSLGGRTRGRVAEVLHRLHGDAELASFLGGQGPAGTCREVYARTLGARLREDLDFLASRLPPFVTAGDFAWMRQEVARLERTVASERAFDEPADRPTHGDLWMDNLLVGPGGALTILDWDDLGLGDPVLDWATLLGPARGRYRPARLADVPEAAAWPAARRERFAVYARAGLLDWVVDGLADWIDADCMGLDARGIRVRKKASVEAALRAYRKAYG